MRKPDEVALFNLLRPRGNYAVLGRTEVYGAADRVGMNRKRLFGVLLKWSDRGWWNYGVNALCGWFEPEAPERLEP